MPIRRTPMKAILPLFARMGVSAGLVFAASIAAGASDLARFAHHASRPVQALLDAARQHTAYDLGSLPVYFEKDPAGARFQTRAATSGLLFEQGGFWVGFGPAASSIHVTFPGAHIGANPTGQEALPVFSNYFLGNDRSQWSRRQHYAGVRYDALWPGIDLVFYAQRRELEYDFNVAPHADAGKIRLRVDGADSVTVDDRGELWIANQYGKTRQPRPTIYQEIDGRRVAVAGGYRLKGKRQVGFWVGAYDHSRKLVIDPVLEFASYIGGSGFDMATAIALDSNNNVYVAGYTQFADIKTTAPAQYPAPNSQTGNVFLVKLDANTKQIDYIDYYGGNVYDIPLSVKVDSSGYVTIVGSTDSSNIPAVNAAVASATYIGQTSYGFAVRFQPSGAGLAYSTYTAAGDAYGVALNSSGAAWVVGGVFCGAGFKLTSGAQQTTCNGNAGEVGYVMQIGAGGALQYASYYAPAAQNQYQSYLNDVAEDSQGNFYVAGTMAGSSTLTRAEQSSIGVYQNALSPNYVCEVTKFNSSGQVIWLQTLGGSMDQECLRIAPDTNYVYLAGYTTSQNFPATTGAFQTAIGKSPADIADAGDSYAAFGAINGSGIIIRPLIAGFVAKYSSNGGTPVYASYLGGNGDDYAWGITVNGSGNAYVTGYTNSRNFPVTPGAPQTTYGGGQGDAFVTGFSGDGTQLTMSTFYGGSGHDEGYYVAADSLGNVWMAGGTESANLPVTSDAFQTTLEYADGMVEKFNLQTCSPTVTLANPVLSAASGSTTLTLTTAPAGCGWTLTAIQPNGGAVPWIQFSPASGSGNETVTMSTTANTSSESRLAIIVANSLRSFVYQSGQTACQYVLQPTEMALTSASERHQVAIQASDQTCSWTASSNQTWLHLLSPASGTGTGAITIGTDPNTTSTVRTATLTIGSQTLTVGQSAGGCMLVLSAVALEFSPAGGLGTVDVVAGSTSSQCSWQAQATQSWIELVPLTNYGSAAVRFSVQPNSTPQPRTGAITVGSQSALISQDAAFTDLEVATGSNTSSAQADLSAAHPSPATVLGSGRRMARPEEEHPLTELGNCGTGVQPPTPIQIDAAGDPTTFTVTRARPGCGMSTFWSNTTDFNVTQAAVPGTNNMMFTITAPPNATSQPITNTLALQTGDTSTGVWTLAVTQAGTAVAPLDVPASLQLQAAAGSDAIPVSSTTGNPCNWTVDSTTVPTWISLASNSGSCGSQLQFSYGANTASSQRTATLQFLTGEQTQLLQQPPAPTPCTYSFQQTTPQDVGFNGGQVTLNVQTTAACSWTASTDSPGWITLPSGVTMGPGALVVQVAANNTTSQRVAQVSVGFTDPVTGLPDMAAATVTEDPAPNLNTSCSYTLSPTSNAFSNAGGSFTFQVTTTATCTWQPSQPAADASYVHLQSTASVTGNGSVSFTVDPNPTGEAARSSSITVAPGVSFTITEAAGPTAPTCSYTLSPTSASFTNAGGSESFEVVTTAGCAWQTSQPPADTWVHIQTGNSGSGPGSVSFTVDANPAGAAARSSSIGVATATFTISEAAGSGSASVPKFTAAGLLNSASFTGGSVAPGELVALFGSNLGPAALVNASLAGGQFPTTLSGTQVLFGGVAAPLLFTSAGQVNAVVPYEVAGNTSTQVVVSYNGTASAPVTVPVAATVPGLFTATATGTGQGAISNADGTANSAANPASPGEIVALYGTGAGLTNPAGVDGQLDSSSVLNEQVLPVTAMIGGINATVIYAGDAPGLVDGMLQVNVVVPSGLQGTQPIVIKVGGVASSAGVTVALKGTAAPPSGTLTAIPNPLNVCSTTATANVTLTWSTANVTSVKVVVGSLTGAVVATSGASGSATVSATPGTTYILVDTSSGGTPTAANVLSQVTLQQGVCATPPTITTASLPGGTVGTAYSASLSAAGGAPPYSWSVSGLPAGLSFSPAGSITGTPTASGNFTIGVKVSDSNGSTASENLALSIAAASTAGAAAPTNDLMQSIVNWQMQFLDNGAPGQGGAENDTSPTDVLDGTSSMYVYSTTANQIVLTMTGPANGWNLSTVSTIQMSMQSDVPPGLWGAGTPYFQLISANGSLTLAPVSSSAANSSYSGWDTLTAPLAGNSSWTATQSGQFDVQNVTSIQVGLDVDGVEWAVLLNGMFLK
jgi:uncharacterized protein (TIGR03437 family)